MIFLVIVLQTRYHVITRYYRIKMSHGPDTICVMPRTKYFASIPRIMYVNIHNHCVRILQISTIQFRSNLRFEIFRLYFISSYIIIITIYFLQNRDKFQHGRHILVYDAQPRDEMNISLTISYRMNSKQDFLVHNRERVNNEFDRIIYSRWMEFITIQLSNKNCQN